MSIKNNRKNDLKSTTNHDRHWNGAILERRLCLNAGVGPAHRVDRGVEVEEVPLAERAKDVCDTRYG